MKKNLKWMLAACLLICSVEATAQKQIDYTSKHEIGIAYGVGSSSSIINDLDDATILTAFAGSMRYDNEKNFRTLSLEYFYQLKPFLRFGGIIGYARQQKDLFVSDVKEGKNKMNYVTVMPALKFDWLRREHVGLYSKLAAGVTVRTEKVTVSSVDELKETKVFFNYQASLLGLEAGSCKVRGFVELGFGEQGIALAGLRFKF